MIGRRKEVVREAHFSYVFWQLSKRKNLIGTVPANIYKSVSQFIICCQRICDRLNSALFFFSTSLSQDNINTNITEVKKILFHFIPKEKYSKDYVALWNYCTVQWSYLAISEETEGYFCFTLIYMLQINVWFRRFGSFVDL